MANKVVNLTIKLKDGVSGVLARIRGGIGRTTAGLKNLGTLGTKSLKTISKATMILGAAMAGAVVEGARFNVQMARVWTMAGGGINTFKKLREQARGLASDFGLARSEIAQGLYGALSAGVAEADLSDFMPIAAKAAVADGSTIAEAVNGITTVLDSFGMATSDAGKMTDLMFQSVAKGKLTFGELAQFISQAASVANVLGVSAEEVFAAISQLSKTQKVATATVNLRNIMLALNKALGEGWGEAMTLQDALQKVYQDSQGSQNKLEEIFGRENLPAMLKLTGANAEEAARFLRDMGGSVGALDTAANKVEQFRHWPKFFETTRALISKIGEIIDATIRPAVLTITQKIKEWTTKTDFWDRLEARFKSIAETATGIAKILTGGGGEGSVKALGSALAGLIKAALVVGAEYFKSIVWPLMQDGGKILGSKIKEASDGLGSKLLTMTVNLGMVLGAFVVDIGAKLLEVAPKIGQKIADGIIGWFNRDEGPWQSQPGGGATDGVSGGGRRARTETEKAIEEIEKKAQDIADAEKKSAKAIEDTAKTIAPSRKKLKEEIDEVIKPLTPLQQALKAWRDALAEFTDITKKAAGINIKDVARKHLTEGFKSTESPESSANRIQEGVAKKSFIKRAKDSQRFAGMMGMGGGPKMMGAGELGSRMMGQDISKLGLGKRGQQDFSADALGVDFSQLDPGLNLSNSQKFLQRKQERQRMQEVDRLTKEGKLGQASDLMKSTEKDIPGILTNIEQILDQRLGGVEGGGE